MQIFELFALIWEHRFESWFVALLAHAPFMLMIALLLNMLGSIRLDRSLKIRAAQYQEELDGLNHQYIREARNAVADYTREVRAWDDAVKQFTKQSS